MRIVFPSARVMVEERRKLSGPPASAFDLAVTPAIEVPTIAARLRLKPHGCRWALERRLLLSRGADFQVQIKPKDDDLLRSVRQIQCSLWMADPYGPTLSEDAVLERIASARARTSITSIGP